MNPSDFLVHIVEESTFGVIPTSPAWLPFDYIQGDMPSLTSEQVTSAVMRRNRASNGTRKTSFAVTDGLNTELRRDPVIDLLLKSAVSGTWVGSTLKAGKTDTSMTIQRQMPKAGTTLYHRFKGTMVNSVSIKASVGAAATFTVGLIGVDREDSTTAVASSTYGTSPDLELPFLIDRDVGVTIDGVVAKFREITLTVEHERSIKRALGSDGVGFGIGTSGTRTVRVALTAYREDLSFDTLFAKNDDAVEVTFTVGSGDEGFEFIVPEAQFATPRDSVDGADALITLEGVARLNAATDTDLIINKLVG